MIWLTSFNSAAVSSSSNEAYTYYMADVFPEVLVLSMCFPLRLPFTADIFVVVKSAMISSFEAACQIYILPINIGTLMFVPLGWLKKAKFVCLNGATKINMMALHVMNWKKKRLQSLMKCVRGVMVAISTHVFTYIKQPTGFINSLFTDKNFFFYITNKNYAFVADTYTYIHVHTALEYFTSDPN